VIVKQHNCHVMALCLSTPDETESVDHEQQQLAHVARTRQAAEWMSTHENGIQPVIVCVSVHLYTASLRRNTHPHTVLG